MHLGIICVHKFTILILGSSECFHKFPWKITVSGHLDNNILLLESIATTLTGIDNAYLLLHIFQTGNQYINDLAQDNCDYITYCTGHSIGMIRHLTTYPIGIIGNLITFIGNKGFHCLISLYELHIPSQPVLLHGDKRIKCLGSLLH